MPRPQHARNGIYYLDQGCLIVLSAAFGGMCLALYLSQPPLLLAKQYYASVALSGIALYLLAVLRAASLGAKAPRAKSCSRDHHNSRPANTDHSWAPWRYVVLLIPMILFVLGLPNKVRLP